MNRIHFLLIVFSIFFINSCSNQEKEISTIKETRQDLEIATAYQEAYKALDDGDPYFAAKKFLEAELLFPQSEWASMSALMAAYSFYLQNFYSEALSNLERFLITYLKDRNLACVDYLSAFCD